MAKTIVITGGGSGLGRALARRFAREGHRVVVLGRTPAKLDKLAAELGESVSIIQCDVASPEAVRAAFKAIAEKHPKIDVLINNAAIFKPFPIAEATDDQIMQTVTINLCGPMLCTREALQLIGAGGHIINVGSESVVVPFAYLSAYQASKAGLENFTAVLEREVADRNIRVTMVRAGQMMDEDASLDITPEIAMRFAQECAKNGVHLRERPISHYNSVTDAFAAVVNMPPDIHIGMVTLSARRPDA